MKSLKDSLRQALLESSLLDDDDIKKAIELQISIGGSLSDILAESGFVQKEALESLIWQDLDIQPLNIAGLRIDPEAVRTLPNDIAWRYQIMVVSKTEDTLNIAMADPMNIFLLDKLDEISGFKFNPVITTDSQLQEAMNRYYGTSLQAGDGRFSVSDSDIPAIELLPYRKPLQEEKAHPRELLQISQQAPVISLTGAILRQAIELSATDILIEPARKHLRIRYRIGGIWYQAQALSKSMYFPVVLRIRAISNMILTRCNLPQEGRFKQEVGGRQFEFRVSSLPSILGEVVYLHILEGPGQVIGLEALQLQPQPFKAIRKAIDLGRGLILVCGPAVSGKSTLLYSILNSVNDSEKNLFAIEETGKLPPGLEGINQVLIGSKSGRGPADILKSILNQDPDVILVGSMTDYEIVDIALNAATSGKLVLGQAEAQTTLGVLRQFLEMGIEPFLLSSALSCVIATRLLRKLCPNCKEPYKISPLQIERLSAWGLPRGKNAMFYKTKGCSLCLGLGYRGLFMLAEVLFFSPRIRQMFASGPDLDLIKRVAEEEGMEPLPKSGLAAAAEGTTSVEEVLKETQA
jgi:type IV pilus assembly protein PilB